MTQSEKIALVKLHLARLAECNTFEAYKAAHINHLETVLSLMEAELKAPQYLEEKILDQWLKSCDN